eukprot:SAG11_NODE_1089_length_5920_cov_12.988146_1_plen_135_part_00
MIRRLASLHGHLSPETMRCVQGREPAASPAATGAEAGAVAMWEDGAPRLTLLTETQVKDYIVNGFLVLDPRGLPGGQQQFANSFYAKCAAEFTTVLRILRTIDPQCLPRSEVAVTTDDAVRWQGGRPRRAGAEG